MTFKELKDKVKFIREVFCDSESTKSDRNLALEYLTTVEAYLDLPNLIKRK